MRTKDVSTQSQASLRDGMPICDFRGTNAVLVQGDLRNSITVVKDGRSGEGSMRSSRCSRCALVLGLRTRRSC